MAKPGLLHNGNPGTRHVTMTRFTAQPWVMAQGVNCLFTYGQLQIRPFKEVLLHNWRPIIINFPLKAELDWCDRLGT